MSHDDLWSRFKSIWVCDTEYVANPGERPRPVCLVAMEFRTRQVVRIWADEMLEMQSAPFPTGSDSLFVAYYASAEIGIFLANGWRCRCMYWTYTRNSAFSRMVR